MLMVSTYMIGMSGTKTPPSTSVVMSAELVITMGSKPGAVTTPPEMIFVTLFDEDEEDELEAGAELTTAACTSRIGAPRSI